MIARGVERDEVMRSLGVTYPTLKEHTQAIYRKFGSVNREDLVRALLSPLPDAGVPAVNGR